MKSIKKSIWYKSICIKTKKTMKHPGNQFGPKNRHFNRSFTPKH